MLKTDRMMNLAGRVSSIINPQCMSDDVARDVIATAIRSADSNCTEAEVRAAAEDTIHMYRQAAQDFSY